MPLVNGRKFLRAQLPTLVTLLAGERAAYQQEVLRLQDQVRELTYRQPRPDKRRPAMEPLAPTSGIGSAPPSKGGRIISVALVS